MIIHCALVDPQLINPRVTLRLAGAEAIKERNAGIAGLLDESQVQAAVAQLAPLVAVAKEQGLPLHIRWAGRGASHPSVLQPRNPGEADCIGSLAMALSFPPDGWAPTP